MFVWKPVCLAARLYGKPVDTSAADAEGQLLGLSRLLQGALSVPPPRGKVGYDMLNTSEITHRGVN